MRSAQDLPVDAHVSKGDGDSSAPGEPAAISGNRPVMR